MGLHPLPTQTANLSAPFAFSFQNCPLKNLTPFDFFQEARWGSHSQTILSYPSLRCSDTLLERSSPPFLVPI